MTKSSNNSLRWVLAALALVITVGCIITTVTIARGVSLTEGINDMPFNDLAKQSLETRLDLSGSLLQAAVLVTGVLWGLMIAKKDETQIVLSDAQELIMFVTGSALLLLSLASHYIYVNNVCRYLADAAQAYPELEPPAFLSLPDIFDQNVDYVFTVQVINLIAGIVTASLTLISAHKIKA